jgi:multiple sugar transport system ATP-binding protein
MADRIAVLDAGRILQIGTPTDIYDKPATVVVAQLVGTPRINLVDAVGKGSGFQVEQTDVQISAVATTLPEHFQLGIRPEDIELGEGGPFTGRVMLTEPLGVETIIHLRVGELTLLSIVPGVAPYGIDTDIRFDIARDRLHFFAPDGKRIE